MLIVSVSVFVFVLLVVCLSPGLEARSESPNILGQGSTAWHYAAHKIVCVAKIEDIWEETLAQTTLKNIARIYHYSSVLRQRYMYSKCKREKQAIQYCHSQTYNMFPRSCVLDTVLRPTSHHHGRLPSCATPQNHKHRPNPY